MVITMKKNCNPHTVTVTVSWSGLNNTTNATCRKSRHNVWSFIFTIKRNIIKELRYIFKWDRFLNSVLSVAWSMCAIQFEPSLTMTSIIMSQCTSTTRLCSLHQHCYGRHSLVVKGTTTKCFLFILIYKSSQEWPIPDECWLHFKVAM